MAEKTINVKLILDTLVKGKTDISSKFTSEDPMQKESKKHDWTKASSGSLFTTNEKGTSKIIEETKTRKKKSTTEIPEKKTDMSIASRIIKLGKLSISELFVQTLSAIPGIMGFIVKNIGLVLPLLLGGAFAYLMGDKLDKITEEGADLSNLAAIGGGVLGFAGGYGLGNALGGPIGGVIGGTAGGVAGYLAGDAIAELLKKLTEQNQEQPAIETPPTGTGGETGGTSGETGGTGTTTGGTSGENSGISQSDLDEQFSQLKTFKQKLIDQKILDYQGFTSFGNDMGTNVTDINEKLKGIDTTLPYDTYLEEIGPLIGKEKDALKGLDSSYGDIEKRLDNILEKMRQVGNMNAEEEASQTYIGNVNTNLTPDQIEALAWIRQPPVGTVGAGGGSFGPLNSGNNTASPGINYGNGTATPPGDQTH